MNRLVRQIRYVADVTPTDCDVSSYRLVEALRDLGVEVEYRGFHRATAEEPARLDRHWRDADARCTVPATAPTISDVLPEHYRRVRDLVGGSRLIAHAVREPLAAPDQWVPMTNAVDAVIVPWEWSRELFSACGVTVPIHVVPPVVGDPVPGDRGMPLGLPDDVVVFYTIARWDPREGPRLAIRAFLEAFTSDDPVVLVVKTSPTLEGAPPGAWGALTPWHGTTRLEIAQLLRTHGRRPPQIRVLAMEDLADECLAGLHARGDCYVALDHSDGWGLPELDACAYGNPLVTTAWGGRPSVLDPECAWLVDHELTAAFHRSSLSSPLRRQWAEPSVEHAAARLREVAGDLAEARRRAAPLRDHVRGEYAPRLVAEQLLTALEQQLRPSAAGVAPAVSLPAARKHPDRRYAYVFYATHDTYAVAVLVFVHLLRQLGIRDDADVVVLHLPLAPVLLEKMKQMGIIPRLVPELRYGAHPFKESFLKLRVFQLSEYDRVVYLDADAMPLRSLNHLFSRPMTGVVAAPRAYWLPQPCWTTALLALQPSREAWNRVRQHVLRVPDHPRYDMDIVNDEFAPEIHTLEGPVFCLNSEWEDMTRPSYFGDPVETYAAASVVHFTALAKPWSCTLRQMRSERPHAHELFYELFATWLKARVEVLGATTSRSV